MLDTLGVRSRLTNNSVVSSQCMFISSLNSSKVISTVPTTDLCFNVCHFDNDVIHFVVQVFDSMICACSVLSGILGV